jgi:hypothetical protein
MDNREAQAVTPEESGHIAYECSRDREECERGTCQFCCGGLFACTICESFEGATTTHCPKVRIPSDTYADVYAGRVDYRDGRWVKEGSPHTPNRGWPLYWNPKREEHYHLTPDGEEDKCTSEFCTFDHKTKEFKDRQTEYDPPNYGHLDSEPKDSSKTESSIEISSNGSMANESLLEQDSQVLE